MVLKLIISANLILYSLVWLVSGSLPTANPVVVEAIEELATCSMIGNNTAAQFGAGSVFYPEATTLALFDGANTTQIIEAINNYPNTHFIIRLGAGVSSKEIDGDTNTILSQSINYGVDPDKPAQWVDTIRQISQAVGGKDFTAMVSHNEWNCGEHPINMSGQQAFTMELAFARTVVTQVKADPSLSNVTLISGQVDHLCAYTLYNPRDKKSPAEYISAFASIPGIDGVSLPFYTGDAGTSQVAIDKLAEVAAFAGGKPIYITESGPFKSGSASPSDQEFEDYVNGVKQALIRFQPKSLLLFNAIGVNTEANFKYTERFWSPSCRQAFRRSCNDTAVVMAACGGSASDEGEHLCRSFCIGDSREPCKNTPGNDCSYPVSFSKLLDPNISELDKEIAGKYLATYLPRTKSVAGQEFELSGYIDRLCVDDPGTNSLVRDSISILCRNHRGDGAVSFDTTSRTINAIAPTLENDVSTIRLDWLRGYWYNREATDAEKFEFGPNQTLVDINLQLYRLSAIQNLKFTCWQMGENPVIDYISSPVFGDVRCMNYQEWPGLGNEKDLFQTGTLSACSQIYQPNSYSSSALSRCKKALSDLSIANPLLYKEVVNLPNIPIATVPVIGAIDELGRYSLQASDDTKGDTALWLSKLGEVRFLNFLKDSNIHQGSPEDRLGALGTAYYIYPLTAGIDGKTAAKLIGDLMTDNNKAEPTTVLSLLRNLVNVFRQNVESAISNITALQSFYGEPNPFWYNRIPENLQQDRRYVALQLNFYRKYEECRAKELDLDASLNERKFTTINNFDGQVTYTSEGSDLDALGKLTGTNFAVQRFARCELFPQELADTDVIATQLTHLMTDKSLRQEVDKRTARTLYTPTEASGILETSKDISDCRFYEPGVGDHTKPMNEGEAVPVWFKPCLTSYCLAGEECPTTLPVSEFTLTSQSKRDDQIGVAGGKTLLSLLNYVVHRLALPEQLANVSYTVYENYCNRLRQTNMTNSPEYRSVCVEESSTAVTSTSLLANCTPDDPRFSDENLPDGYSGTFKYNVINKCQRWHSRAANKTNPGLCYNEVVIRADQAGVNPTYALAIWANESGCSNYGINPKIQDFGINNSSVPAANFQAQFQAFLVEAKGGLERKMQQAQFSKCFDTNRWSNMEAYMFIYQYGSRYKDFSGKYPSLNGKGCEEFSSYTQMPHDSYYANIMNGAWRLMDSNCPMVESPTDNTCRPRRGL